MTGPIPGNRHRNAAERANMTRADIARALAALDRLPVPRTHPAWLEAERVLIRLRQQAEKECGDLTPCRQVAAHEAE